MSHSKMLQTNDVDTIFLGIFRDPALHKPRNLHIGTQCMILIIPNILRFADVTDLIAFYCQTCKKLSGNPAGRHSESITRIRGTWGYSATLRLVNTILTTLIAIFPSCTIFSKFPKGSSLEMLSPTELKYCERVALSGK